MTQFKKYRRTNIAEMRPYVPGESLDGVSVSDVDDPENDHGMIARNPNNHNDQRYVARKYFEGNFEPIDDTYEHEGQLYTGIFLAGDVSIDLYKDEQYHSHMFSDNYGVRAEHIPTGLAVQCSSEKSMHMNRYRALDELRKAFHRFYKGASE